MPIVDTDKGALVADMKWSPEDWARLGVQLRKARERQGLSRKRLADASGVSEKSIQLTEEGRVPTRWPKSIGVLAQTLGWAEGTPQRVLDGEDPVWMNPLFTMPEESVTPEVGKPTPEGFPTTVNFTLDYLLERYGVRSELLPQDLAAMVPMVAQFSMRCAEEGASTRLVLSFDGMASIMLSEVVKSQQERERKNEERTPEQLMIELRDQKKELDVATSNVKKAMQNRLAKLRATPPDTENRDLEVRAVERGLAELESVERGIRDVGAMLEEPLE